MFLRLILIVLAVYGGTLVAQDSTGTTAVPRHAVRISPLHLANFYPTIQTGYETRLYGKLTGYLEGGYVVDISQNETGEYANMRGFKLKIEPRYYFFESVNDRVTFYGALELYGNRVDFDRNETVIECYDEGCVHQYRRQRSYVVKYREKGFVLKWGMMLYIKRFFFDLNAGMGVRGIDYIKPEIVQQPEAVDDMLGFSEFAFQPIEEKRTVPGLALGMRLGYRIR